MVKILQIAGNLVCITCLAAVFLGYLGAWHPAGDSFAVFRVPLACLALVLLCLVRAPRWLRLAGGVLVGLALIGWAWLMVPPAVQEAPFTLYQKNLLYLPADRAPLIEDILNADPDFVTLQEVSRANRPVMQALKNVLPSQHYCPFAAVGGVAVLSRYAIVPGSETCVPGGGMAAMQVQTGQGPVWIVALHLQWPWPHPQAAHVDQLLPSLRAMQGPKLIAGDFNTVAWSHTIARIEAATGTARVAPLALTFTLPHIPMRIGIDHILAYAGGPGRMERRPLLGSDHNGLLAWVRAGP